MAKLSNNDIFILIKSLSMSEKRNFKIFASRHVIGEENIYVALFDDIEKQTRKSDAEYDEDELLKDERYKKHLPTLKTRLYETILKSLDSFHANSSVANRLNNQLHYAEILYKKKLYDQADKIISKAKILAIKYECFGPLVEIYNWEIKIMSVRSFIGMDPNQAKSFFKNIFDNLEKNRMYFEYMQLTFLYGAQRARSGVTRQNLGYYKELRNNDLYSSPKKATSFHAKYHYYFGRTYYHFIMNSYDKAHDEAEEVVKHFKNNAHQIPEFPGLYGMALYNLGLCKAGIENYNDALKYYKEAKEINIQYPEAPANIYYLSSISELNALNHINNYKVGLQTANDVVEKIQTKTIPELHSKATEILLYHSLAVVYFGGEKYTEAKKWLNKILNENVDVREDLYCCAKILNLIIHYELGNNDLLEYLVKSSYRFLYKKKRLLEFENLLIKFMQLKLPKAKSTVDLKKAFVELKTNLENLFEKQPEDKQLLRYFDFMRWINSKIENKKFHEMSRYNLSKK